MTDAEKDRIQLLLKDEQLLAIVHKVFRLILEESKPIVNVSDNNELLGEKYRAYELAKEMVEAGFRRLETYKQGQKDKEKLNRAR